MQTVGFYLRTRGPAVLVAWLLYSGIALLLTALEFPIASLVTRTVNSVLQFIPGASVTEFYSDTSGLAWFASLGAIVLTFGLVLGLMLMGRKQRQKPLPQQGL